ncbi:tail fiber domain-containing protein [Flavobacterium sp. N1994]|uniref:tail fiber domain-containing protein n=1 Tax=Flavobacterium sp. N1994 TaxID=2986827 RepID=UPI0022226A0B|nr:tail fiber domain-containing protein [Flavobacterium sp. N1994]
MKKIITLLVVFASVTIWAQAPERISYQAVIRNASNALVTNTNVRIRVSILQDVVTGPAVYVETHSTDTNSNGLVSLEIGGGTVVSGDFYGINWGTNTFFIKTETDPTGGTNYTITGTSQFLSVPYALYAQSAGANNLQQVLDAGNTATKTLNSTASNGLSLTSNTTTASPVYRGIVSTMSSTTALARGVQGVSNGNNAQVNVGSAGFASNSSLLSNGLYGFASGTSDNYGVWGIGQNAIGDKENRGVMGYAITSTATGWNYGTTGFTGGSEIANIALGGYADAAGSTTGDNYGVSARATAVSTTGTNYGIYSEAANGATNYAGFFNGDVTITGTFVQPSDRKLKKDIHTIGSALDKINALEPVSYLYDGDKTKGLNLPKGLQYGFIAQDLETVFPNLVTKQVLNLATTGKGNKGNTIVDAEGNVVVAEGSNATDSSSNKGTKEEFKGINYTGLISILTQGIKEQQAEIKDLKAQNEALEQRMQRLEKLLLKQ